MEQHREAIHGFVLKRVRNEALADDITQETYAKALAARGTLREPRHMKPWLHSIAKNLVVNHALRSRETVELEVLPLASPRQTPEDEVMEREEAKEVWATATRRLTPWRLSLLRMHLLEDLSTPEIAKRLGVSKNHAAVRVSEAKQMVREAVNAEMLAA